MASYKGHMIGGIVVAGLSLGAWGHFTPYSLDWSRAVLFLFVGILGSLFPDVDTNSRGQDLFYSIFFLLDLVLMIYKKYEYAAFLGFFALLPVLGKHRGWTHTWWAMLLVPLPILVLPVLFLRVSPLALLPYYVFAVIGYFSHLLLDWKFK